MSDEPNTPNEQVEPKKDGRGLHSNSRKNLKMWVKGQSGNPSGARPHWAAVKDLARQYTVEAIQALYNVMTNSKNDRAKVAAADAILDRGWGKPAQVIEGEGERLIVTVRTVGGTEPWVAPQEPKVQ